MRTRTTPARRLGALLVVPALAAVALLTACTAQSEHLSESYQDGTGGNYISGDGLVVTLAADQRDPAVTFEGELADGGTFDSADALGGVVVVNFWYASCPPCRQEAPDLETLRSQFEGDDVTFVGVNTFDTADNAASFEKEFGVGYPSIVDAGDNGVQLAFAGNKLAQNATPTTLLLDRQGRVAARISGLIESPSVVSDIVDELLAEKA